jgi:hypothetical protein
VTYELITTYLGLTVKCYEENEDPCQRHVIVDEKGHNAGFTSFVEEMMKRLEAKGVRCVYCMMARIVFIRFGPF